MNRYLVELELTIDASRLYVIDSGTVSLALWISVLLFIPRVGAADICEDLIVLTWPVVLLS